MNSACKSGVMATSNISRRTLISGMVASPVVAPALAQASPGDPIWRDAAALAETMRQKRGGEWTVHVGETYAIVQRVFAKQP